MTYFEIKLDLVLPVWTTLKGGRRAIVLDETPDRGVLLILPDREAWVPVHRLWLAAGRAYEEIREAERGDVHRGGTPTTHGPLTGPVGRL